MSKKPSGYRRSEQRGKAASRVEDAAAMLRRKEEEDEIGSWRPCRRFRESLIDQGLFANRIETMRPCWAPHPPSSRVTESQTSFFLIPSSLDGRCGCYPSGHGHGVYTRPSLTSSCGRVMPVARPWIEHAFVEEKVVTITVVAMQVNRDRAADVASDEDLAGIAERLRLEVLVGQVGSRIHLKESSAVHVCIPMVVPCTTVPVSLTNAWTSVHASGLASIADMNANGLCRPQRLVARFVS